MPSGEYISELKEATVLLNKILKDAPASYSKKKKAHMKVKTIDELTSEAAEYDYTNRLVENAQITEMEDSVMKYSLVRDNIRIRINNLTQQLK